LDGDAYNYNLLRWGYFGLALSAETAYTYPVLDKSACPPGYPATAGYSTVRRQAINATGLVCRRYAPDRLEALAALPNGSQS